MVIITYFGSSHHVSFIVEVIFVIENDLMSTTGNNLRSNKILLVIFFLKTTVKPVLSGQSNRRPKIGFKTNYLLMQVKRIAERREPILSTFIKLPFCFV